MRGLTRLRPLIPATLLVLCLALALPASGLAESTPTYTKETQQAYEAQLKKHEIASAVFNKRIRSLRITTKSGEHFTYKYPKKGSAAVEAQLKAKHVPFSKLTPSEAKQELKKKPVKHKLRYIVGGVVIVIVVIIGLVLVLRRRRQRED